MRVEISLSEDGMAFNDDTECTDAEQVTWTKFVDALFYNIARRHHSMMNPVIYSKF